jgi:hypothetical protein
MPKVVITAARRRRWWPGTQTKTWTRTLPECWAELPNRRRRLYYGWALQGEPGMLRILTHLLNLPRWAMGAVPAPQLREMRALIEWMTPAPDCENAPWAYFKYQGRIWHLPKPLGENMTCIEYPLADEYYLKFVQDGDDAALLMLVATLVREEHPDSARRLREDDPRTPLHSRAEVSARATALRRLPVEYQMTVLMWYAGMKQYVHRVYGPHLFEQEDDTEDDDHNEEEEKPIQDDNSGDGFGWWGVLQDVAEAGLFGTMKDVYQANFHEVCMWLVRKRIAERQMKAEMERHKARHKTFE